MATTSYTIEELQDDCAGLLEFVQNIRKGVPVFDSKTRLVNTYNKVKEVKTGKFDNSTIRIVDQLIHKLHAENLRNKR